MWNALARLALHARLPNNRNDQMSDYGDKQQIRAKVEEVVCELERIATGTMSFPGIGEVVSFDCQCGEKNKRRVRLLRDRQHIHCINPDCKITWRAVTDGERFVFEPVTVAVNCEKCKTSNHMPWRVVKDMKRDAFGTFSCHSCKHKNHVQWRLTQVRPEIAQPTG
jgi:hypothetical protein